ncbi:hypothetical protein [Leptospira koniambonensis]|uniref:hypothetical protein n=1 Tax=Leptospira koniambonensis TaxID=2484950 RepID=UPI00142E5986|nr:hypothetical protein [Leptospira koniambonensis]
MFKRAGLIGILIPIFTFPMFVGMVWDLYLPFIIYPALLIFFHLYKKTLKSVFPLFYSSIGVSFLICILLFLFLRKFIETPLYYSSGPFFADALTLPVAEGITLKSIPYKSGHLEFKRIDDARPTVLAYKNLNNVIEWAYALKGAEEGSLHSNVDEFSLAHGITRDRIFLRCLCLSNDLITIYLWKSGRFDRFYLSW